LQQAEGSADEEASPCCKNQSRHFPTHTEDEVAVVVDGNSIATASIVIAWLPLMLVDITRSNIAAQVIIMARMLLTIIAVIIPRTPMSPIQALRQKSVDLE